MFERFDTGLEVRAEGRKLSGAVLVYGDVSPSHRERFEPGSLRMSDAITLNLLHDPERAVAFLPGGGLTLTDTEAALELAAELPPIAAADRALEMVRSGEAGGLSIEFRAMQVRFEKGLRVIEKAQLRGVGLVKRPSYKQSKVEARERRRVRWL